MDPLKPACLVSSLDRRMCETVNRHELLLSSTGAFPTLEAAGILTEEASH